MNLKFIFSPLMIMIMITSMSFSLENLTDIPKNIPIPSKGTKITELKKNNEVNNDNVKEDKNEILDEDPASHDISQNDIQKSVVLNIKNASPSISKNEIKQNKNVRKLMGDLKPCNDDQEKKINLFDEFVDEGLYGKVMGKSGLDEVVKIIHADSEKKIDEILNEIEISFMFPDANRIVKTTEACYTGEKPALTFYIFMERCEANFETWFNKHSNGEKLENEEVYNMIRELALGIKNYMPRMFFIWIIN